MKLDKKINIKKKICLKNYLKKDLNNRILYLLKRWNISWIE